MTDPIERAREVVGKMTPGTWEAWNISPQSNGWAIRAKWTEGTTRLTAYPAACSLAGGPNAANAAGIVLAVSALRVLCDEGTVEAVAMALRDLRIQTRNKNNAELAKDGLWPDNNLVPTDEAYARAVISAILTMAAPTPRSGGHG